MGKTRGPKNRNGCESKIDLDIDPSGYNGIVSNNNWSVTINQLCLEVFTERRIRLCGDSKQTQFRKSCTK